MYDRVNELYRETNGKELAMRDFHKMFKSFGFLESLLCKQILIPESIIEDTKINYLVFATGVWLQDKETLFDDENYSQDWEEIGYKYLASLYTTLGPNQTAEEIHSNIENAHLLKKCSIKQWINYLCTGPLQEEDPTARDSQKCITQEHKDDRINLPPFYSQQFKIDDLLNRIEVGVTPFLDLPGGKRVSLGTKAAKSIP